MGLREFQGFGSQGLYSFGARAFRKAIILKAGIEGASTVIAGVFFASGAVFHNKASNRYLLLLGFKKWAALGMQLEQVEVHGKESGLQNHDFVCPNFFL